MIQAQAAEAPAEGPEFVPGLCHIVRTRTKLCAVVWTLFIVALFLAFERAAHLDDARLTVFSVALPGGERVEGEPCPPDSRCAFVEPAPSITCSVIGVSWAIGSVHRVMWHSDSPVECDPFDQTLAIVSTCLLVLMIISCAGCLWWTYDDVAQVRLLLNLSVSPLQDVITDEGQSPPNAGLSLGAAVPYRVEGDDGL